MMSAYSAPQQSVIKVVEGHVERLISEHKRLSERNRDLTAQCDKLKARGRELQERVMELERELSTKDMAMGLTGGLAAGDRQRARAYVNRLMREIDACLTYMTSPECGEECGECGEEEVDE